MKRIINEYGKPILFALLIAILVTSMIRPTLVREYSMYPTIVPYSYIIVNKVPYIFGTPAYDEIVVFNTDIDTEHGEGRRLIKRVIGLAGDTIEIKNGTVYRNGQALEEDYVYGGITPGEMDPVTVSKDHIFVMGDNRPVSLDSRDAAVGEVALEDIFGRADFRLFPFNQIGVIK
jgi:signal peptidase I